MMMQAIAPLVLAFVAERWSDPAALAVVAAFALMAFVGFVAIRRPERRRRADDQQALSSESARVYPPLTITASAFTVP